MLDIRSERTSIRHPPGPARRSSYVATGARHGANEAFFFASETENDRALIPSKSAHQLGTLVVRCAPPRNIRTFVRLPTPRTAPAVPLQLRERNLQPADTPRHALWTLRRRKRAPYHRRCTVGPNRNASSVPLAGEALMGHVPDSETTFTKLQRRIDCTQSGLPATPEAFEILAALFTREEAEIACNLPIVPRRLSSIARRLQQPEAQLREKLERMAERGLVFDFHHPVKGDYFMLAPPVVGFFEFSMMRVRQDIDQKHVARLLSSYMYERSEFMREIGRGGTPIGRTLVHENTLAPEVTSDILDYERAGAILDKAKLIAVSLCYCRHKKSHLGEACNAPQEICMSLNMGAEFIIRRGHGRRAAPGEARALLDEARAHNLVQVADNVKKSPSYLCNCCGCCCGQLVAVNRHGIEHALATSNFIATIDQAECTGCAKCLRVCPIQAISLHPRAPHDRGKAKSKMVAKIDDSICLGCGVCKHTCSSGSLAMCSRPSRLLTPVDTMERVLRMAIGRGHLHDVLFDEHDGPTSAFLNRLTGAIEALPVTQRAMVNDTLKSRFVAFLCKAAKRDKRQPADLF